MKVGFLGPQASFTQLVASQIFPEESLIPQANILDCFSAVQAGDLDKAVVPLENSIEGTVSMSLDYLYDFKSIFIEAEAILPIVHHLMVHPQNQTVAHIISHPQALAQTFQFRRQAYPNSSTQDYSSTAAAAKWVSEHPEQPWAAVANTYAAQLYGLKILHSSIQDFEQNHTRFIIISKQNHSLQLPHQDLGQKTGLMITLPNDYAGGLHQVLSVFAWRRMNLSKIESRTLKTGLGNYFFYINIVGDWENILYQNAIAELESLGVSVRFLGNYHEYRLEG